MLHEQIRGRERGNFLFYFSLTHSLTLTLPSPIVSFPTKKILFTGPTSTQVCYRQPTQRERTIGGVLKSWVLFFFFFFPRNCDDIKYTHTHEYTNPAIPRLIIIINSLYTLSRGLYYHHHHHINISINISSNLLSFAYTLGFPFFVCCWFVFAFAFKSARGETTIKNFFSFLFFSFLT